MRRPASAGRFLHMHLSYNARPCRPGRTGVALQSLRAGVALEPLRAGFASLAGWPGRALEAPHAHPHARTRYALHPDKQFTADKKNLAWRARGMGRDKVLVGCVCSFDLKPCPSRSLRPRGTRRPPAAIAPAGTVVHVVHTATALIIHINSPFLCKEYLLFKICRTASLGYRTRRRDIASRRPVITATIIASLSHQA